MDAFETEFSWPSGDASEVILTGSFDHWSCSIHLPKGASGFAQRVRVPWNEKVPYKFIVDGRWVTRDDRPTEFDGAGNLNNVLFTPTKPTSTMDHPPTFAVTQALTESMSSVTALPEVSSLYSDASQQEVSKVDEGGGITESDSTGATSAVVDLVVSGKERSPLNVPDVTVHVAEPAEPSSEADSLSAIVGSATSPVPNISKEIATSSSVPEYVSPSVSIAPSMPSDPLDNILDGAEQPSATSALSADVPDNVQEVLSLENADAVPQIAPIVRIAILPVNDHTLNESASLSPSDSATSVNELSTHSPMNLSKAASPARQETQSEEQSVLNPDSEPTQEENSETQVVEQGNGELLVDATPSDPANGTTPETDVDPKPVEPVGTPAADAESIIPQNVPFSQAPEPQGTYVATSSSISSTPGLNSDTKVKDVSSISTNPPVNSSSKFSTGSTRKKRRSLFAKLKDFFSNREKK